MKKLIVFVLLLFITLVCIYAETQTIVLISKVETKMPKFYLRCTENNESGDSIVYNTSKIDESDVKVGFDIVQTNDSNYRGSVEFTIRATELKSTVDGKNYSTNGVQILIDGKHCGHCAHFIKVFDCKHCKGECLKAFEVVWSTNDNLAIGKYNAIVSLTYTAA